MSGLERKDDGVGIYRLAPHYFILVRHSNETAISVRLSRTVVDFPNSFCFCCVGRYYVTR